MYFSGYYSYGADGFFDPEIIIKQGEYDLGCAGGCPWFITTKRVPGDFCVAYSGERYALLLLMSLKEERTWKPYQAFKAAYPDLQNNNRTAVVFTNTPQVPEQVAEACEDATFLTVDLGAEAALLTEADHGRPRSQSGGLF